MPTEGAATRLYPMLDDRNDTVSARQMAGVGVWDRTANDTGWTALLGADRGGPDVSPYAAPVRTSDLSNLPPAFFDVGSAETFRDEVVAYAQRRHAWTTSQTRPSCRSSRALVARRPAA